MFPEATKDKPQVDADWQPVHPPIDGVEIKDVRNILTANSLTTELFRPEWLLSMSHARHILHVSLYPRAITAWHMHKIRTDSIFVIRGRVRLVLFDGRERSPTEGKVSVYNLSIARPRLVSIPRGVWHGLQNLVDDDATFINTADVAYQYDDPDEWRVPQDFPGIPYQFSS